MQKRRKPGHARIHTTHSRHAGRIRKTVTSAPAEIFRAKPHFHAHSSFLRSLHRHKAQSFRLRRSYAVLKRRHSHVRALPVKRAVFPDTPLPQTLPKHLPHRVVLHRHRHHSHHSSLRRTSRYLQRKEQRYTLRCPASRIENIPAPIPKKPEPEKKKKHWGIVLLALLVFFGVCLASLQTAPVEPLPKEEVIVIPDDLPPRTIPPFADPACDPFRSLPGSLELLLSQQEGDWSVYLKRLNDGAELIINEKQMPSASLIKLFVAGVYKQAVEDQAIAASSTSEYWLEKMISLSDNTAWVNLETYVGYGNYRNGYHKVTDYADSLGMQNSGRLINGNSADSADTNNYTSASEVGWVLEEIYNGTYVSEEVSEQLLNYMKNQHFTHKIPAGLPEGVECANKTGELVNVQNDAAIVYGSDCTYILVILSHNGPYEEGSWKVIREISSLIYNRLNS